MRIATDYYRRITVWITKEQSDKIEQSDCKNESDYIREAIDEKNDSLADIKQRMKVFLIEELISNLSDKKEKIVRQSVRQAYKENDEDVRQIYSEIGFVRQNEQNLSDKNDENVRQTVEEVFQKELQLVANSVQLNGKLSSQQLLKISKRLGIKQSELRNLIDVYYEDLLKIPQRPVYE